MPVSLQQILDATRQTLPALKARQDALERDVLGDHLARPSFRAALRRPHLAVIAEVKRRSPSAGSIREDLDPAERAALYAAHGAAAISILTDTPYFGGSVQDLRAAAERCALPLLRKDFIIDEIQILEARAAGASAVLLIVRILTGPRLDQLVRCAELLGLDALVEVHTKVELATALDAGATLIGVNSRDLDTLSVDVDTAWRLLAEVPIDRIAVAESGLAGRQDVARAAEAGADAVLIGTALSAAESPAALLRELSMVRRHGR
ncbi:MAG TPA: indole-3-glycerol phosphate synthase TrpC [Gemmatimonadales bacterium]|nr:indole-3-glycerol phosphate synthase TrpC [Gemmatimonadales bacterium]